ncbi:MULTISPECIES: flagellar assembly protein A [unclassified Campylobacter]|uniref:flagellar assembly protein A n=1 Tax=unclassified Campylobacter TaxID=2593542 RepID=UPI001BDA149E|nr:MULTISPECIES: flagellar assembly protein A [unclassified Campylobacter]MBZ7980117.1 DUF342 domain-containing protein [Campylobacter sp. RM12642]MBZ7984220.1 DUF342 domain-containing protein [Campylobacter sp. RM12647]MBT0878410.1 DUF342 domain-containing protein [Campylobacter sp. 2018MI01]MBT0880654.1 DUF342 domain-containing protein [Campylobacter sp. 2018MI27]MBT0883237.1 DUF342 domain-containing protein [Campylobacter sp. 2018MI13]
MEKYIIKTDKPYDELTNYANRYRKDINNLDFKVLHYETIITKDGMSQTLLEHELEVFNDDKFFNDDMEIKQIYEIEIIDNIVPLIDFKIGTNKNLTKVVANFSAINYDDKIEFAEYIENIRDLINKKFIKAGLLLGIREFTFQEQLVKMLKAFESKQIMEASIVLAKGIEPINAINSETKLYYKDKKVDENAKIDYSQRGFINAISKDELIIEFIKPIKAVNGKDLKGNIINATNSNIISEPDFKVSENIRMLEDDLSIKYYANINGYVTFVYRDKLYDIKDSVSVQAVEFKTTGSIDAGINKDITLNVDEQDYLKDAVGANLSIEVSTLNVKGNIAQNSVVKAKIANIGGQTHSKSKIYAKKINIEVHRGYCEGEDIEVNRLENGVIVGKNVRVKHALGGKIIANKVMIDTLTTNTTIEVSDIAVVKECLGENNKFLVSASKSPIIVKSLEKTLGQLAEVNKNLLSLPKIIDSKKSIIDANKDSIMQIKQRLAEMKQSNIIPPTAFLQKIRDYQNVVLEYNDLITKLKDFKDKHKDLEDDLKRLQNKVYEAKVINTKRWANLNEIKFKLLYPDIELTYNTKEYEDLYCLKLERVMIGDEESAKIVKLKRTEVKNYEDEFMEEKEDY